MNSEIETFIAIELAKAEARKAEFIESIRADYPTVARLEEGRSDHLHNWYSGELSDVIAELERHAARERLSTPSHGNCEGVRHR